MSGSTHGYRLSIVVGCARDYNEILNTSVVCGYDQVFAILFDI